MWVLTLTHKYSKNENKCYSFNNRPDGSILMKTIQKTISGFNIDQCDELKMEEDIETDYFFINLYKTYPVNNTIDIPLVEVNSSLKNEIDKIVQSEMLKRTKETEVSLKTMIIELAFKGINDDDLMQLLHTEIKKRNIAI